MINPDLKRRIIEISYKHKLSHLGSCLTAVDIIEEIFSIKMPDEKFVLSSGHAGLALYVVLEKYDMGIDAEGLLTFCGIHPDRPKFLEYMGNMKTSYGIDCSTGSLGQGLPIAVGMALADRTKNVHCLISDGECSEGSIWEALRIQKEQELTNLKVYLNFNGWGAYKKIDSIEFSSRTTYAPRPFINTKSDFPFLQGQDAHYKTMNEAEYKQALELLV